MQHTKETFIISSKKQKLDTTTTTTAKAEANQEWPPAYGSQTYWEQRYQKNLRVVVGTTEGERREAGNNDDDNDVLPFYSWYFTYQELAPLILPIILGGDGCRCGEEDETKDAQGDEVSNNNNKSATVAKESVILSSRQNNAESVEKPEIGDCGAQGDELEHSDYDYDDEEEEDDDDDDDEISEREGLAKNGPISIIEIGCGDMPLGRDLAIELSMMEEMTGAKADSVVKEIVCCDYSSTVIRFCQENRRLEANQMSNKYKPCLVNYVTADARKIQYPACSFHLVLEKGTLDAMLSDTETGVDSCIQTMAESARVLKEGGYIMLVSHINAHTESGVEWLNTVVVVGLRAGGGKYSKWEIEVHGSDVNESNECNGDETNHKCDGQEFESGDVVQAEEEYKSDVEESNIGDAVSASPSSYGPAVYIIHNLSKSSGDDSTEDSDPSAVPLHFFTY